MKLVFLIVCLFISSHAFADDAKEVGLCYTGTHCNCRSSKTLMTRTECSAALDDEGLFGVGSWKNDKSKTCEKIGSQDEHLDHCRSR